MGYRESPIIVCISEKKKVVIFLIQGARTPLSFKTHSEILDLGPPVNAAAHYRILIF